MESSHFRVPQSACDRTDSVSHTSTQHTPTLSRLLLGSTDSYNLYITFSNFIFLKSSLFLCLAIFFILSCLNDFLNKYYLKQNRLILPEKRPLIYINVHFPLKTSYSRSYETLKQCTLWALCPLCKPYREKVASRSVE